MKRLSLLLLGLFLMGGAAHAQKPFRDGDVFSRGDVVLNLGVGLGNMVYNDNYTKKVPPISLSGEYAVTGNLFNNGRGVVGLGGYIGYTGAKYRAFDNLDAGWNFNNLIVGVRGALHYQFVNRLDTYVGLFLGYNISMTGDYGSVGGRFRVRVLRGCSLLSLAAVRRLRGGGLRTLCGEPRCSLQILTTALRNGTHPVPGRFDRSVYGAVFLCFVDGICPDGFFSFILHVPNRWDGPGPDAALPPFRTKAEER